MELLSLGTDGLWREIFKRLHSVVVVCASLIVLWAPDLSVAQTKESARQQAFAQMQQGKQFFAEGKHREAISSWRRAFDIFPDNQLLYYIASTYERVEDACAEEQTAWQAYMGACNEEACTHVDQAKKRYDRFKSRCFTNVEITSNAVNAVIEVDQQTYKLPYRTKLIKKRYAQVKVSAPQYLSLRQELDLRPSALSSHSDTLPLHYNLVEVPPKSMFERYQLPIALGTVVTGVVLLSFGSLQLNQAISLSQKKLYQGEKKFGTEAEDQAFVAQYYRDRDQFSSHRTWGVTNVTLGLLTLGAGIWMITYRSPNAELFEQAEADGVLSQFAQERSGWHVFYEGGEWGETVWGSRWKVIF